MSVGNGISSLRKSRGGSLLGLIKRLQWGNFGHVENPSREHLACMNTWIFEHYGASYAKKMQIVKHVNMWVITQLCSFMIIACKVSIRIKCAKVHQYLKTQAGSKLDANKLTQSMLYKACVEPELII